MNHTGWKCPKCWILMCAAAVVLGLLLMVYGCDGSQNNDHPSPVPTVSPTVTCCHFADRNNCRNVQLARVDGEWARVHSVCFECGECLLECPPQR